VHNIQRAIRPDLRAIAAWQRRILGDSDELVLSVNNLYLSSEVRSEK
jgi:hypothetical protein